ncbi:uncharacterized protein LOC117122892 isoform X1 [Anneissia japonica]|uniref:uncharacterized protein LOC117122892 isoform X1 n=1 Tax=Anneissia japonica TaxID=1529436 RepID=UPI0014259BD8|nr:uncharacterized protein LOC117122892 isoform X1 [Anneissia japonica]
MSGRTKSKKKSFLSKFPSFRKKKSSSLSPDKDANANPQIPPHPDFATDDNDTFTQPTTLNLNTQEITRVDNPNFKVPPVPAAYPSTTSQTAKRPNATDEYQVGSVAKRLNSKSKENGLEYSDTDCTIIVNASLQSGQTGNTNQDLRSAFFGTTSSSSGVRENGEILNDSSSKATVNTDLQKTFQTSLDISAPVVSSDKNIASNKQSVVTEPHTVDHVLCLEKETYNKDPWQHKSDIGSSEKNKNTVWLSKGNTVKSPSCQDTPHSMRGKVSSKTPSPSLSQNETFVKDYPVLDPLNTSAISVSKDSHNLNNTYLLDKELENKNRSNYPVNTAHEVGVTGKGDACSQAAYKALKKTDLNIEEIELQKPSIGSSAQQSQASLNKTFESSRTITTGQERLTQPSPQVSNNQVRKARYESQSQSDSSQTSASHLSSASTVPTQSTPAKEMPLSSVRHPQLSAVKGLFRSMSVESTEMDSLASDDLMCDSRFMDDEMIGFDEESFLNGMADGPKSSILQTRLARYGRIRSQSFEVSSKNEERVVDSRRLRSITMGASPPSKVYDSAQGGTIPEEPRAKANFNERSKENHVGIGRLNRSLHLNLPSQLSFASDEEVTMDANTFRHLMQDMTNMKTMLFKLKRVIQDNNNAMTGSLPTSPITACNPLLAQDNILVDLTQENVQLKTELNAMKKQIEETDKTVTRLHEELVRGVFKFLLLLYKLF